MSMAVRRVLVPLAICCGLIFLADCSAVAAGARESNSERCGHRKAQTRGSCVQQALPDLPSWQALKENPFIGKNLRGILKNVKPEQETAVRESIQKGGDRMPGFRYTLTPAQIEDLMAYLKTYN